MVTLKKGDKSPAFTGKDQDGKKILYRIIKGKSLYYISILRQVHPPAPLKVVTCGIIMGC